MKIQTLNLTINVNATDNEEGEINTIYEAREALIDVLRNASIDKNIVGQKVIIPDSCEKYGFAEGNFDVSVMIHFLADMLE